MWKSEAEWQSMARDLAYSELKARRAAQFARQHMIVQGSAVLVMVIVAVVARACTG